MEVSLLNRREGFHKYFIVGSCDNVSLDSLQKKTGFGFMYKKSAFLPIRFVWEQRLPLFIASVFVSPKLSDPFVEYHWGFSLHAPFR